MLPAAFSWLQSSCHVEFHIKYSQSLNWDRVDFVVRRNRHWTFLYSPNLVPSPNHSLSSTSSLVSSPSSFKSLPIFELVSLRTRSSTMGCQCSKRTSDDTSSSLQNSVGSQVSAGLESYVAACRADSDLQSFDTSLHERASRVIDSLAVGLEVRSLSLDSLKEVTGCLLEMNQEVVNVILECKKDIWKNQDLFDLVEEYFDSSLHTLDFCTSLEKCLKRARDSQLIVQVALQKYEEERQDGLDERKYRNTLQELNNFKAAGDPFTEDFFTLFRKVQEHQVSMLRKLQGRRKKLDNKLKSLKAWRTVSNVVFVAVFASVLIFSVVAAAIAAPPVVAALAGALAIPVGSMGKWINSLWKKYENALKGEREILSSMQAGTLLAVKDLGSIRALVDRLRIDMESLLLNADLANEDTVEIVMDEIITKVTIFRETIDNLCEHAGKCSQHIRQARTVILQRIIKFPGNGS